MEISYEHANPGAGNESFFLRINREYERQTPCLLVDAGDGVDPAAVLRDDEYLAAILLTHAHLDHYQSLADAHRDGAPVFVSPGTAAILDDVLREGTRNYSISDPEAVLDRVEAIEGWEDVVGDDISVAPVPVGHAPGACGFLIRARDGDDTFRALATGDFTRRDAGGCVGFDPEQFLEVDALFLTAATTNGVDETITEIVETAASRANAGSKTLCTASGLTGVHLATLLGAVDHELDYSVPVTLVGQIAKLYDGLGYEYANVETVPEFTNPQACLETGTVTIAGPEVPVEGSSERLFEAIRDDGNATLVQVQGGTTTAKDAGEFAGTVSSFAFSNHPTEAVLDRVVETIAPTHVVVTHQRGRSLERYKDKWDAYTWATGSAGTETLYRDGTVCPPPWVGDAAKRRVRNRDDTRQAIDVGSGVVEAAADAPELERREPASLEREGVDVDRLRDTLYLGPRADDEQTATDVDEPASSSASDQNTPATATHATDGGLYRTVGQRPAENESVTLNPDAVADEVTNPTVVNVLHDTTAADTESETAVSEPPLDGSGNGTDDSTASTDATETDAAAETSHVSHTERTEREPNGERATDSNTTTGEAATEDTTTVSADERATETETLRIDPAIRALAERQASDADESVEAFVASAVTAYLEEILRGHEPWTETAGVTERTLTIDADQALEQLIETTAATAGAEDADSFVVRTLCEAIGLELDERELPIGGLEDIDELIVATTENEACPHETKADVVQAALEWHLL